MAGLGLTLMIGVLGCGGDGGGTCATPAACGGNIVGKWKVSSSCLSIAVTPPMDCAGEGAKVSNISVSGDATYNADLTYSLNLSLAAEYAFTFPAACLTSQTGVVTSCSQVQAILTQTLGMEAGTNVDSATCSGAGGGCNCNIKISSDVKTESGTYTTAGNVLTETATGGQPDPSDYCVQGNKLQLLPHMMAMGGMSNGAVSGSIVLTKQ